MIGARCSESRRLSTQLRTFASDVIQALDIQLKRNNIQRMIRVLVLILLAILSAPAWGQAQDGKVGDQFQITLFHESESKGENGSSSSSSGGHEYLEQILFVGEDGVERRYDITLEPDDDRRLINWQFPVRVFEGRDGSMVILNRVELENRRDEWLEAAEIPVESCGTWYFTWNAFQVECDPDAILETIKAITIQPENLIDGAAFNHPAALNPGRLQSAKGDSGTFSVEMPISADYFHRTHAQSDVVVGEIMREPISFEEAYAKRQSEQITGKIKVVLKANADGQVREQITSIEIVKTEVGGEVESGISTETIKRKRI